jgi:hypothetical protein
MLYRSLSKNYRLHSIDIDADININTDTDIDT